MGRRRKKKTIKQLRKEADELWRLSAFRKEKVCFVCGSKEMLDIHHFVPRRISLALRYDLKNAVCLCRKCHNALHWKSDPMIPLIIAFKKGKEWVDYLKKKKREKVKLTTKWLEEQIEKLKKEYIS